jgi:hypothetical protein
VYSAALRVPTSLGPTPRTGPPALANSPTDLEWHANKLDPEHKLPDEERMKRAGNARRAYFARLSLKSKKARQARRQAAFDANELQAIHDILGPDADTLGQAAT